MAICKINLIFEGSLTESICTAYESKMAKSVNIDAKSHSSDSEKEIAVSPVTNLTSMLGGKACEKENSQYHLDNTVYNTCLLCLGH